MINKVGRKTDFVIQSDNDIFEAIKRLDRSGFGILFVEDVNAKVLGTITDGDIRRGLLRGKTLDTNVKVVMNTGFCFISEAARTKTGFDIMKREGLHHLPILGDDGAITSILHTDNYLASRSLDNPVIIMAGGEGKRLRPHTLSCPKPMLLVNGKPMLQRVIESCVEAGFVNFFISVNYLKEKIMSYFGDGEAFGVNIAYLEESVPLGTAGSLDLLDGDIKVPLLLINGDVLTKVDYQNLIQFHQDYQSDITLCVSRQTTVIPFGVVEVDDVYFKGITEKPSITNYINCGIYVINPSILGLIDKNTYLDMTSLLELAFNQEKRITTFLVHEEWSDVGVPEALTEAHQKWQ